LTNSDPAAAQSGLDDTHVRANRYDVLSRLADDLAHEIKNPFNAIVVNLEVARRRIVAGSVDGALERADIVEQEVRRVHSLVDELLQLLRPTRSETGPVAVDGIIESLASALHLQARAARVTLEYKSESSLYAQIRPDALKFALLNLLSCAIDAEAEAGGTISVTTRRAAEGVYAIVMCSRAVLSHNDDRVRYCGTLMESAGGEMEAPEPQQGGSGSTVTLVMPPGRFS